MRLDRARLRRRSWGRIADDLEGLIVALAYYPAYLVSRFAAALRLGWRHGERNVRIVTGAEPDQERHG